MKNERMSIFVPHFSAKIEEKNVEMGYSWGFPLYFGFADIEVYLWILLFSKCIIMIPYVIIIL